MLHIVTDTEKQTPYALSRHLHSTHGPCLLTAGVTPAVSAAGPWSDTAGRRQDEESNYSALSAILRSVDFDLQATSFAGRERLAIVRDRNGFSFDVSLLQDRNGYISTGLVMIFISVSLSTA